MRKYFAVARVSLQSALTYRAGLFASLLQYAVFLFVFFNLWRAIYAGGGVMGLSFQQIIWYLCFTELIAYGARATAFRDTTNAVKNGEIVYQLLRPYRFIGFQLAQAAGQIAFKFVCFGALALVTGFVSVGALPDFPYYALPAMLLSLFAGIAINLCWNMALGLSAFRIEENSGLYFVYSKLVFMLGAFIPLEFLPGWLQTVARCLPFSYVSWAPARLIVGFSWELFFQLLPMQLLWIALSLLLSAAMYRSGMRALQGQGG